MSNFIEYAGLEHKHRFSKSVLIYFVMRTCTLVYSLLAFAFNIGTFAMALTSIKLLFIPPKADADKLAKLLMTCQ